ncbi:MAG: sigma-54-dependent Fis family transcriptional regulator [Deltaproteobacteria bacterium]|nr:MAG: sigma-54-dependent Fis family transcriptional regulator [Deltaproteobacteria bacterium]RLC15067.1 MAG: sigma-54-dependent Fis family transcriptional regulator [Deltaproteobacteria bacterium]
MPAKILIIDDDKNLLRVTEYNLSDVGFMVDTAAKGSIGLQKFREILPDLVITDVKLGDMSGLDVLETIKRESPDTPVIVFTAFGSIDLAVSAMQKGAFHFITKPFDREMLRQSCWKALELKTLKEQNRFLSAEVNRLTGTAGIKTASATMRELLDTAIKVAHSEATVLITGESGTGKEVLARLIHMSSHRSDKPMVAVNCAAIPESLIESELFGHVKGAFTGAIADRKGRFQAASSGTLFLDEIAELKLDMQAKLLRAIQEREVEPVGSEKRQKVDIRIVAATNTDLGHLVRKGMFREDLFYRLSVIPLHIPPLRERTEDIEQLVSHFLKQFHAPLGVHFNSEALTEMKGYDWPGNIRELQNMVERCVILRQGVAIGASDLKLKPMDTCSETEIPEIPDGGISLESIEKGLVQKALQKSGGNRSEAARLLHIPRHVLIYRIEKYGI